LAPIHSLDYFATRIVSD